jgi:pectinesterase
MKVGAQTDQSGPKSGIDQMRWRYVIQKMPDSWFGSDEAKQVTGNVLLYQRDIGGWPKNIEMHKPLTDSQKDSLASKKSVNDAIFDNGATTQEMLFLAKVYKQTRDERLRDAFNRGLNFILEAQYDNGGWPMFYPLKGKYYNRITFNDNAMVNLLKVLKDICTRQPYYDDLVTDDVVALAKTAYDKGVQCILDAQIVKNGKKTVWCAQHDEVTLEPAYGRPFEHPSFSGAESKEIILFLMDIENPSPEVIDAVKSGVEWLDNHRIKDKKIETFVNENGRNDRRIVDAPGAPDLWARFYHLELEVPIFGDYKTPPEILFDMADIIDPARRYGYHFYGTWNETLISELYPRWKEKNKIE